MKKLIFLLILVVIGVLIWQGVVHFSGVGDKDNPGVNITVNRERLGAVEKKAEDIVHKELTPSNP